MYIYTHIHTHTHTHNNKQGPPSQHSYLQQPAVTPCHARFDAVAVDALDRGDAFSMPPSGPAGAGCIDMAMFCLNLLLGFGSKNSEKQFGKLCTESW